MSATTSGNGHVLSQAEFSAELGRRLEGQAEVELIRISERDVEMRVRGLPVRASLASFYSAYTTNPARLETVIHNFIEVALGFVPNRSVSDYNSLSERIFPMLKPVAVLAEVRERKVPMLAYQLFLADLVVTYVIQEPQSVVYINEEHLERWGLNERELHEQALGNLRRRTLASSDYTMTGEGSQRLFIWSSADGYDATRLLLADLLMQWQAQVPGHLVIGVPNRDFLIAFSDSDRTVLTSIARQVQLDSTQRAYGLTDQLFTVRNGEIHEYEWE